MRRARAQLAMVASIAVGMVAGCGRGERDERSSRPASPGRPGASVAKAKGPRDRRGKPSAKGKGATAAAEPREVEAFGVKADRLGSLDIATAGESVAVLARSGGKWAAVKDGAKVGEGYDSVIWPVLGPRGRSLAFVARSGDWGGKWAVVRDGKRVGKAYDQITSELVFSPDGRSLAFAAKSDGKCIVIKDGVQVGGEYQAVDWLAFSPDGRSLAFAAQSEGKWAVLKDGQRVGGEYDEVSRIATSRDGARLVFAARRGKKVYRVQAPW